jgi:hypothetical protein
VFNKGVISYKASKRVAEIIGVPWDDLFKYVDKTAKQIDEELFTTEEIKYLKEMILDFKEKRKELLLYGKRKK